MIYISNENNEKKISVCDTGALVNSKSIQMSANVLYGLNPS